MSVAWAHYSGSAYEQTEQSKSWDVHAARAPHPGRRGAGVAQAERDRIPAHMATGEHQEALAGAGRRRPSRRGEVCRRRDDDRALATSGDTSRVACDEEDGGSQGTAVESQGKSHEEDEDSRGPQVEEHHRQGKVRQGDGDSNEADDEEADACDP